MGKITIEFDDNILAKAIGAVITAEGTSFASDDTPKAAKASKKSKKADKSVFEVTAQMVADLCKEIGASTCRPVLKELGFTTPKAIIKDDPDSEELTPLYEALKALQEDDDEEDEDDEDEDDDEDDDEDEDDEDEDEINVDVVKKAVQAFAKENGKDEADEILEEFDIKSVRSLKKLDQEQLEELYEAVSE